MAFVSMAQEPHTPTDEIREEVLNMRVNGLTQERIAEIHGVSVPTLKKYYKKQLDDGLDKLNAFVCGQLQKKIRQEDLGAIIFWLKTRAGWREARDDEGNKYMMVPLKIITENPNAGTEGAEPPGSLPPEDS